MLPPKFTDRDEDLRVIAAFLALSLALPSSALALRTEASKEAGVEEQLQLALADPKDPVSATARVITNHLAGTLGLPAVTSSPSSALSAAGAEELGRMREFGKTGLKFNVLGAGTIWLGRPWSPGNASYTYPEKQEIETYLESAYARLGNQEGIVMVDTAASYGFTEERLGEYFRSHPAQFQKTFIATKWGERQNYDPAKGILEQWTFQPDYSVSNLKESVDSSLELLGKIDLLYLHMVGGATADILRNQPLMDEMVRMKHEGQAGGIRFLGASISDEKVLEEAVRENLLVPFDVIQMPGSVFLKRPDLIKTIRVNGKAIVLNSVIRKGDRNVSEKDNYFRLLDSPAVSMILTGSRNHYRDNMTYVEEWVRSKSALAAGAGVGEARKGKGATGIARGDSTIFAAGTEERGGIEREIVLARLAFEEELRNLAQQGVDVPASLIRRTDGKPIMFKGEYGLGDLLKGMQEGETLNVKGKEVLVLGAGAGSYPIAVWLQGAKRAVGIDLDPVSVQWADFVSGYLDAEPLVTLLDEQRGGGGSMEAYVPFAEAVELVKQGIVPKKPQGLEFHVADARHLPFPDDSFDLIIVPWFYGIQQGLVTLEDVATSFKELIRVGRKGAKIYLLPIPPQEEAAEQLAPIFSQLIPNWFVSVAKFGEKFVVLNSVTKIHTPIISESGGFPVVWSPAITFSIKESKPQHKKLINLLREHFGGPLDIEEFAQLTGIKKKRLLKLGIEDLISQENARRTAPPPLIEVQSSPLPAPVKVKPSQDIEKAIRDALKSHPGGRLTSKELAALSGVGKTALFLTYKYKAMVAEENINRATEIPPRPPIVPLGRGVGHIAIVTALRAHPGGWLRRAELARLAGVSVDMLERYKWKSLVSEENARRAQQEELPGRSPMIVIDKQTAILAVLAVHPGGPLTVRELADLAGINFHEGLPNSNYRSLVREENVRRAAEVPPRTPIEIVRQRHSKHSNSFIRTHASIISALEAHSGVVPGLWTGLKYS